MRVLFTRNHHVSTGARSRRMYKRGREYGVTDEIGKAAVEAKCAKAVRENEKVQRPKNPTADALAR